MTGWFSRLSLQGKILLSTSVSITVLFAVTGRIVLDNVSRTTSATLEEEVRTSFQAYDSLWQSRARLLSSVSRILSGMSDVRAAFSTGDQATIRDSAGELWAKVSDENAVFLVTDPRGRVIASLGGAAPAAAELAVDAVRDAAPRFPQQSSGFVVRDGRLFHLSVTPVYVQSTHSAGLINVLVAGYYVDALVAQKLKQATGGSEFLFVSGARVVASTLNQRATGVLAARPPNPRDSDRVSDGVVEYARLTTPLLDLQGKPAGDLYILRSFEVPAERIAALQRNIVALWLMAVLAGLAVNYLLARRITGPVQLLDLAAAEVARQNYNITVPVKDEDELGRLARTFNDMCASIRQAREELIRQERISTVGRLSGSIVHDLRNPLAAIYGGAEMLVDRELSTAQVKRLAGNIYNASRRIQEMLQELLDASREAGGGAPETCRLGEVAAAACDALAPAAEARHVGVSLLIPPEIELPLARSRMERVFVNLVGNAIEAMPEGGAISIRASVEERAVRVEVEDTGPGVPAEMRPTLFQPFVSQGKKNGLGLGLALSRQTVLDHGGDLWLDSPPGQGARFVLRLPLAGERGAEAISPTTLY
jgi:signal transduction histidine kinase